MVRGAAGGVLGATLAALALAVSPAGADQPVVIGDAARTPRPGGVAVGNDGSLFLTYDATSSSRLARLTPDGQITSEVGFGGLTVGRYGKLAVDRGNGAVWHLSPQGFLDVFDPATLAGSTVLDLRQTPVAGTNDVYDVSAGVRRDMSGSVLPALSSYGDLALRRSGERLIVMVTARATNGTPFVLRLRFDLSAGLVFQDARAIAASSVFSQPPGNPRGIALTPGGRVFTTLPVPDAQLSSFDRILTFDDGYPEAGGGPIVGDGGRHLPTEGADAAADASFYATGPPTSVTCGALSTGGVTVLYPSGRIAACHAIGSFDANRDVAVSPASGRVYSIPPGGPILDWGPLAPGAEPARPAPGTVPATTATPKRTGSLAAPRISGLPTRVRIGRRSRAFTFTVKGSTGVRGTATLTRRAAPRRRRARSRGLAAGPPAIYAAAARSLARRTFRLHPRTGRARVRLVLSRRDAARVRRRRVAATLTVQLRDSTNRTSRATRRLVLLPGRRAR